MGNDSIVPEEQQELRRPVINEPAPMPKPGPFQFVSGPDQEIDAIGVAYRALCDLDMAAKARALTWLEARFEADNAKVK